MTTAYHVENTITKEFAIVEPEIARIVSRSSFEEAIIRAMDDSENWDNLINAENNKGKRYVVLDDKEDVTEFLREE